MSQLILHTNGSSGDVLAQNGSLDSISPIVSINGQDSTEFLINYASLVTLRDADARYVYCVYFG